MYRAVGILCLLESFFSRYSSFVGRLSWPSLHKNWCTLAGRAVKFPHLTLDVSPPTPSTHTIRWTRLSVIASWDSLNMVCWFYIEKSLFIKISGKVILLMFKNWHSEDNFCVTLHKCRPLIHQNGCPMCTDLEKKWNLNIYTLCIYRVLPPVNVKILSVICISAIFLPMHGKCTGYTRKGPETKVCEHLL